MCQNLYMAETAPFDYDTQQAEAIQPLLNTLLAQALATCRGLYD
jgi:N-formylglutamate amidohydrolase